MNMFKPTKANTIRDYIDSLDEPRKNEIKKIDKFIRENFKDLKPWFAYNMPGYGQFHYKTKSGREGDWPVIALASQKNYISVYICGADGKEYIAEKHKKDFPKASVGKSCIRFKKLEDIEFEKLAKVMKEGSEQTLDYNSAFAG